MGVSETFFRLAAPDERELRALFAEIDLPSGVDRWRELAPTHQERKITGPHEDP